MISFAWLWIRYHNKNNYANSRYISHIVSSIANHTTYQCDFVCVTDQVKKQENWNILGYTIRAFPLIKKFKRHQHNKLEIFRRDLELCERAVLTDLDNFIVGNIDELLDYRGVFGARSTFWRKKRPQPQLSWAEFYSPSMYFVWDEAKRYNDNQINKFAPTGNGGGDQLFVYRTYGEFDRFDDLYPGQLESWKQSLPVNGSWDERVKIIFAHGHPKPHHLNFRHDWSFNKLSPSIQNRVKKKREVVKKWK